MKVNLTLFIQAGNFFIAYIFITRFFLKPILEVVRQENKEQEKLASDVAQENSNLALKKEFKNQLWQKYQHTFNQQKPKSENQQSNDLTKKFEKIYTLDRVSYLTQEEVKSMVNDIAQVLKAQVIKHD